MSLKVGLSLRMDLTEASRVPRRLHGGDGLDDDAPVRRRPHAGADRPGRRFEGWIALDMTGIRLPLQRMPNSVARIPNGKLKVLYTLKTKEFTGAACTRRGSSRLGYP